jgi:hypothetical protein
VKPEWPADPLSGWTFTTYGAGIGPLEALAAGPNGAAPPTTASTKARAAAKNPKSNKKPVAVKPVARGAKVRGRK